MPETIAEFVTTPRIERLLRETFTQKELVEAFAVPSSAVTAAVTRLKMQLISDHKPSTTRRFHYYDAPALLVFISFAKQWPNSAKKTLTAQVSSLLFGDPMTPQEAAARRAEVTKAFDAANTPSKRAKFAGHMFKVTQARRREIQRHPFSANPLWWSCNGDQNFVIFGRTDHQLLVGLFDRNVNGGKVSFDALQKMKAGCWVNVTELLCRLDARLIEIVERREARNRGDDDVLLEGHDR